MEEAENGQDEDGHEIELGMIVLAWFWCTVCSLHIY